MANVYLGSKKKKRSKFWISLIIIIVAVVAFFGFFFYRYSRLTKSPVVSADALTYVVSYSEDLYFIRVLNNNRKVMVMKIQNGTTFPGQYITLTSDNLEIAARNFLNLFELKSDVNYYLYLSDNLANELISKLNGTTSQGIDGLLTALKNSKFNMWEVFTLGGVINTIKDYDRSSNIDQEGFYALINAFSKYAITNYDKLTIPLVLDEPLQINIGTQKLERKYADVGAFQRMKEILE
ncbi:hypothetical protein [Petrotoga sp. 9PWA.NaAc.5.4]|uniref:hypothetical protein n=1 Tax=Petrotoga sp. 9PWA.NaAc.5.4 TaxID=1434328 RepID=UPI000CC7B924|nr:hypothetical protein [Petrotoga sp. 9PWA.NaAc.5.4]PNR92544.1 hypothetical protein X924_09120 [Petrotoga sp. 9PWA.NaAc.5.4]